MSCLTWWAGAAGSMHAATPLPATGPLSEEARQLFYGSPVDPPAAVLMNMKKDVYGFHFLSGNEKHLENFYAHLKGLGGGYMGVGTDQAYLFIGWMRPTLAWLTDYDHWVMHLHRVYHVLFRHAETPEEFLGYWGPRSVDRATTLLESHSPSGRGRVSWLSFMYRQARWTVAPRLQRQAEHFRNLGIPTYLTDLETYRFVRQMILEGRIRPMVVDLLADEGVQGIARVARALGVTVRVIYLSNAEQYWKRYSASFRANMQALPFDERSFIMRTLASHNWNQEYRYNLQVALNFAEWMKVKWVRRIYQIVERPPIRADEYPLTVTNAPPELRSETLRDALRSERQARGKRKVIR